jgi:class 3 adenylate cyclase/tetratricopeptide (TPR) repeat protein
MTFDEVLDQVRELLQSKGRVTYRALKRRFDLDDEYLEDLKSELIKAERSAVDEDGEVLVWVGARPVLSSEFRVPNSPQPPALQTPNPELRTSQSPAGERRQLTVMFCDLVGSTALSEQLDPEELREVIRAYQQSSAAVIERYEGHIAQYLGDGLLVYFGYPTAHEDDAARAVRAGLEIIEALRKWVPSPLVGEGQGEGEAGAHGHAPLQVRIGIHTGLVVVGEVGGGAKREQLALGETPNIAARVQSQAAPSEVVVSATTLRLLHGVFAIEDLGPQALKGISTPMALYRVVGESAAQSRFEVAVGIGLTPLVGREEELSFLQRRWTQAKDGAGQVVLLSGEPGIGKSRLVQALKEQVSAEGATRIEFRCSPYHQNSTLYPIIDHLQRLLQFAQTDAPAAKLEKLQHTLSHSRFPQADTLPLLAALLSLPHPEATPPITVSPQKQKEKTQAALMAWLVEEAEKAAVYCTWEDLHWADPSTLEVLTLFLDQVPTTRLLALLTFRPEFTPPWGNRSHLSQMTLSRLGRPHVETMVEKVTRGKALPAEVVQHIVAKTDGVPLFVEELTKTVLESVESIGSVESMESEGRLGRSAIPLGIPATLQDALMARLDRLESAKEIAQLSATLGREFSYELLQAVSPLDEATLQHGLKQLVAAELVYQRGLAPQAHYLFKHALIQDTAYHSLLKSARQQYHHQIAQVLEEQFPETKETQPEMVAHHYTEAGLAEQAIPYWQRAGQNAIERSAHMEAIHHLTKGLEALKTLPDTANCIQLELLLQIALGTSLMATKGWSAPEVERTHARARALCLQVGASPQLVPVLRNLYSFYVVRAEYQTARELGEEIMDLARRTQSVPLLLRAHLALGQTLMHLAEFSAARLNLEEGIALSTPSKWSTRAMPDPGVACYLWGSVVLWMLGYPTQALQRAREALSRAREQPQPFNSAYALIVVAMLHYARREGQEVQERAETAIALAEKHGFTYLLALGQILRGRARVDSSHLSSEQQQEEIAQMRRGLASSLNTGAAILQPYWLALLAEAYGKGGQAQEGLHVLAEALVVVCKTGECICESELYRLKGELTLQQSRASLGLVQDKSQASQDQSEDTAPRPLTPNSQAEAEECFLKAIEIARHQQAKSLELRATVSLARLWQQQGKKAEARQMLAEIYGWFTEGFDTKDLQEAKALLAELT